MDFFQRQDDSRSRSFRFFLAFSLAVLLAVIALYFIVTGSFLIVGYFSPIKALPGAGDLERLYASALPHIIYGNPSKVFSLRSFFCLSSLLVLFILALSMFKTGQIRRGGGAFIAELLGGRKLTAARTLEERRLLNMTLELALAANLPQPRISIL